MMLAGLFTNPLVMPKGMELWMVFPLCAVVAIIYKTVRISDLSKLVKQVAVLVGLMFGGLVLLGAALWLIQDLWP